MVVRVLEGGCLEIERDRSIVPGQSGIKRNGARSYTRRCRLNAE